MSGENMELAREFMDALTKRDLPRLTALADPEIECYSFFAPIGSRGAYRGHPGLERWLVDLDEAFDAADAQVNDAIGVGAVVLLVGCLHYRGKSSGVEAEMETGWAVSIRERRVASFRAFRDPEEALASVGLPELASPP